MTNILCILRLDGAAARAGAHSKDANASSDPHRALGCRAACGLEPGGGESRRHVGGWYTKATQHLACCAPAVRMWGSPRRYEVQGEYVIPPNVAIPRSATDMALVSGIAGGAAASQRAPFEQSGSGRWRVQARARRRLRNMHTGGDAGHVGPLL